MKGYEINSAVFGIDESEFIDNVDKQRVEGQVTLDSLSLDRKEEEYNDTGINIFSMLSMFEKNDGLDKENLKRLKDFERDYSLESKILDSNLDMGTFSSAELGKIMEYFQLFTTLKTQEIKTIKSPTKKNNKKTRWRDIKKK